MNNNIYLMDYNEWRNCIELKCKIPLTAEFIKQRLEELQDPKNAKTREFIKTYGEGYTSVITNHYNRALQEVS